ncbi:pyridoxamine 5'-phosphate oxidase [Limibacter armeniacum]|uniref:pyridoxamine 5'-phosphate oxidase n=1 Tax=Limibacter armeniacum TaxID=466084 RepID=UPI002FE6A5B7
MKVNIADIRLDYAKKELSEEDCLANPIEQFNMWMEEAIKSEVNEPTAMTISTVSPEGRPAARTVLLKGVEDNQFVFYTNYNSRKGTHLLSNPVAALTFFWPELERQVNIEGTVTRVSDVKSDEYFASRPYKSRVGAWASEQSSEITSKNIILKRFATYAAKYLTHVPRPPHWGGFAISPDRIEFWQGRPSRLHDRVLYTLDENGNWNKKRLAP